ncbi:TonB-dependent receptor [Wenzhouxiangella sp. XN79A]|uniref:TonB-dependent receptor domain-containing protein n=1 Tax=Wenzhouxiangella sp. XN79A TaxID=2724193 RepID=UPI00144ACFCD|nr:TonB-dependent receptor [Wenzhouxiangella sp. XN79A]NKI36229.1 TonB-dependent receptor [Wenzhouxiangella sp. XN79A]
MLKFECFTGRRALSVVSALSLCLLMASGSSGAAPDAGAVVEIDPLVVTANRTEQREADVPARVSVITRERIEASQAPDLAELLRLEAGIDVARPGGPGGQTSVFLRGTNSNHVLVLIDGVRVSASGTGAFTWEILDPALIERIEIVRGPRAARWGSDAIGGVIQIFTRRAEGASARVAYGSDRDRSASVSVGGGSEDHALDLTAAWRKVDGFSAQNESGFAFDPDDDGFENLSAAIGGRHAVGGGRLDWRGRFARGETEFDQGVSEFDNGSLRIDFSRRHGDWRLRLGGGLLSDELETETGFGRSRVETRRLQLDLQAERTLGAATWLIGADAWQEDGESADQWNEDRFNLGLFTGLEGARGALDWEAAVRADRDSEFGTELTGNAAVGYRFGERWRAFGSIGRAFRAPNFSQLYSPGFGGLFAGNPDLDPERSWSVEAGLDWRPTERQALTLSVYRNRIDDLIDFSGVDFQAININEARIRGVELTHRYSAERWYSEASATWQDPQDLAADRDLLRRAEARYAWSGGWRLDGGHRLGAELLHVGTRLDVGGLSLDSYTLVNLRGAIALGRDWTAEVRVDNLADEDYEPLAGFNAPDRRVFLALAWRR